MDEEMLKVKLKSIRNDVTIPHYTFYCFDLEMLWESFVHQFKVIDAAGGIVKNELDEILFIYRKGKWDLPKGKVDKGELIKDAGVREVQEECGIREVSADGLLTKTYHTYVQGNKTILKRTYWYNMFAKKDQQLEPQLEEDISEVTWLGKESMGKVKANTYKSIAELLDMVG